ncbi:MAG: ABC transporter substrate-binding protein [Rubrivivax sp.]|nr:ABC transporter substrate-binding protein [Rubrivivax sp.]
MAKDPLHRLSTGPMACTRRAALLGGAGWGLGLHAAQATPRRLGVLMYDDASAWSARRAELERALAALGWTEGTSLRSDWRYAEGSEARLDELAGALVRSKVDTLLSNGVPATRALQRATRSVPIVTGIGDPVGMGYAQTLARPGGNVTGQSYAVVEAARKQIELLRELVPALASLALVLKANRRPYAGDITHGAQVAAREAGLATRLVLAADGAELERALRRGQGPGREGALVFGFTASIEPAEAVGATRSARVPAVFEQRRYVELGGLASYQLDWGGNQVQRLAAQLDKVLRGADPAALPFEFPTRSEVALNMAAARALGLAVPASLRVRADHVIE